jgi:hypothetical protein
MLMRTFIIVAALAVPAAAQDRDVITYLEPVPSARPGPGPDAYWLAQAGCYAQGYSSGQSYSIMPAVPTPAPWVPAPIAPRITVVPYTFAPAPALPLRRQTLRYDFHQWVRVRGTAAPSLPLAPFGLSAGTCGPWGCR